MPVMAQLGQNMAPNLSILYLICEELAKHGFTPEQIRLLFQFSI